MSDRKIPLRRRDGSLRGFAVVDAEDYDWLNQWRWFMDNNGYAVRQIRVAVGRQHPMPMHRQILGLEIGDARQGDHLNRERLDNRRSNLRIVTKGANAQNRNRSRGGTSKYRGVCWNARVGKFYAYARLNYKLHHLGVFEDEKDAAEAAASFRREHMPHSVEATV